MIPILILYTLKRLNVISVTEKNLIRIKSIAHKIIVFVLLLILTTTYASNNPEKSKPQVFQVLKNQKVIGTINMTMNVSGDSITYKSNSKIDVKLLLSFKITGKEISVFKNGVLVYSSVYRTLNSNVKVNHSITQNGSFYKIHEDKNIEDLNIKNIEQNLVSLYFNEPKGVKSIFCDNEKEMIAVKYLGQGQYKVEISNGKYNIFHYENGRCVKVEAVSAMFNVTLIPI